MTPLVVLVDLDGIVVNLLPTMLKHYNAFWGTNVTVADCHSHEVDEVLEHGEYMKVLMDDPKFWIDIPDVPGAIKGIKEIRKMGHTVEILSSPWRQPATYGAKIEWCARRLPFLLRNDIHLVSKKFRVKGDVLIDDHTRHHLAYRAAWPDSHILTIAYPYNQATRDVVNLRAESWKTPEKAWEDMVRYVQKITV